MTPVTCQAAAGEQYYVAGVLDTADQIFSARHRDEDGYLVFDVFLTLAGNPLTYAIERSSQGLAVSAVNAGGSDKTFEERPGARCRFGDLHRHALVAPDA